MKTTTKLIAVLMVAWAGMARAAEPISPEEQTFCRLNLQQVAAAEATTDAFRAARIARAKAFLDDCLNSYKTQEAAKASQRREQQRFAAYAAEIHDRNAAMDQAEHDQQALLELGRSNPDVIQIVDSGNICDASNARTTAAKKIAEERRYAKVAGVVNLSELQELKESLREADQRIAAARSDLKRLGRKAISCGDKKLADLQFCYAGDEPAGYDSSTVSCGDESMRSAVALFGEEL